MMIAAFFVIVAVVLFLMLYAAVSAPSRTRPAYSERGDIPYWEALRDRQDCLDRRIKQLESPLAPAPKTWRQLLDSPEYQAGAEVLNKLAKQELYEVTTV